MQIVSICVFGVCGVLSRYFAGLAVGRLYSGPFPLGTFMINVVGSFLIGVVYVLGVERALLPQDIRVGLLVGFLGGFTTFSSYSLETTRLLEQGNHSLSLAYWILSPTFGVLAALAGLALTRFLLGVRAL